MSEQREGGEESLTEDDWKRLVEFVVALAYGVSCREFGIDRYRADLICIACGCLSGDHYRDCVVATFADAWSGPEYRLKDEHSGPAEAGERWWCKGRAISITDGAWRQRLGPMRRPRKHPPAPTPSDR